MDTFTYLLIAGIGGAVLFGVISLGVRAPGYSLQSRFAKLGNMTGMTEAQIVENVGPASSVSYAGNQRILQWLAGGYHIVLTFEGDRFVGITHESAQ